ncbi:MAG TPA: response regulator [Pyrinomonadaceae bacterium]
MIEYTAAAYHFEQAGHIRYQACVENNMAFLFFRLGRFVDAHTHLDRAQILFARLKDDLHTAQVDETRARVLLAEARLLEAEKTARRAVRTLETGDAAYLLVEALTTHATTLARLRHSVEARSVFERAISVAEEAGDTHGAGVAALSLIEELGSALSDDELSVVIDRANSFLGESRELATVRRLATNACNVVSIIRTHLEFPPSVDWTEFSFPDAVRRYEAHFIKLALKDAGGKITRAARLLGLKGHQSLTSLLKKHPDIPIIRRKKSIIPAADIDVARHRESGVRTVRILHVEDDKTVAGIVKEMLEDQGWHVETCADGNAALEKISGEDEYDLLLVDYDLPGVNGIELISHARELDHRCDTPMVVLAGSPVEAAARDAGADVFLQKPQALSSLVDTINRLLEEREHEN